MLHCSHGYRSHLSAPAWVVRFIHFCQKAHYAAPAQAGGSIHLPRTMVPKLT